MSENVIILDRVHGSRTASNGRHATVEIVLAARIRKDDTERSELCIGIRPTDEPADAFLFFGGVDTPTERRLVEWWRTLQLVQGLNRLTKNLVQDARYLVKSSRLNLNEARARALLRAGYTSSRLQSTHREVVRTGPTREDLDAMLTLFPHVNVTELRNEMRHRRTIEPAGQALEFVRTFEREHYSRWQRLGEWFRRKLPRIRLRTQSRSR